jgi:hypothetical protein
VTDRERVAGTKIYLLSSSSSGVCVTGMGSNVGGKTMDKIQFNNLSVSDQACLLLDAGDLLATNCYYHYNVLLYNYENHFMELVYDKRAKQVLLVRAVNDNILEKYLDNIHLELDL